MTPELQAWLQANGLTGGSEADPYNLGDYASGAAIGNSGLYRQHDEGSAESIDSFLNRAYQTSMGQNGEWGTAGRGFNQMQNAGFFNTLDPVNIGGAQYHRIGEDITSPDYLSRLSPKTKAAFQRLSAAGLMRKDPTYGYIIPQDAYTQLAQAHEADNAAAQGPLDSGLSLTMMMAAMAGGGGALAGLGEGAGAGGIFSNLYSEALAGTGPFAGAGASAGALGGDIPWGVNPQGLDYSALSPDQLDNLIQQVSQSTGEPFTGSLSDLQKLFGPNMPEFGSTGQTGMLQSIAPEFPGAQTAASVGPGSTLGGESSSLWSKLFSNPTSPLGRILNGSGSPEDYLRGLGTIASSGLGLLGANTQANALGGVADKYLNIGAPFRAKLAESYGPGFDLSKDDPAFKNALDLSSQSVLKNLSTSGNPFDNPGAVTQAQKYVTDSVALPQLNTYRSQLGGFGGLGINTAGTADLAKAQTAGSGLDAVGYGLGQLTGNSNSFEDILKKYGGLLGSRGFALNEWKGF